MTPEHSPGEPASPIDGVDRRAAEEQAGAPLDAVERDVVAGEAIADALRERLGIVLPSPIPADQRVPVDEATLRAYIGGTLPTDGQERVLRLIWGDPAWRAEYLRIKYPPNAGE